MPSLSQVKEITASWQNKKVGVMFAIQYAHYAKYIDEPEESNKIAEITFTINSENKIEDINAISYMKFDEEVNMDEEVLEMEKEDILSSLVGL